MVENLEQQTGINLQQVIEQRPFENPAVQSFFERWCWTNDFFVTRIIPREEWVAKAGNILEKTPNQASLYLPSDLTLWEMVDVMAAIDNDTFTAKPERQNEKKLLETPSGVVERRSVSGPQRTANSGAGLLKED